MQLPIPFRPSCSCCEQPCENLCRHCGRDCCEDCTDELGYCSDECREARKRERELHQTRTDLPF